MGAFLILLNDSTEVIDDSRSIYLEIYVVISF